MRTTVRLIPSLIVLCLVPLGWSDYTRNIMITGYWPVTNDMLRPFSTNPEQNPDGWIGGDWEGRGYNIYSYFPEFTDDNRPVGEGDFEVDYQDTSTHHIIWPTNPAGRWLTTYFDPLARPFADLLRTGATSRPATHSRLHEDLARHLTNAVHALAADGVLVARLLRA